MPAREVVWRDGELIPFAEATTHVLSHMSARGSQVFDVLMVPATVDGPAALGLRPHVTRFVRSAELMGMGSVGDVGSLERAVAEVVLANADPDRPGDAAVVKLIAAWAEEAVGLSPARIEPTVYVVATPPTGPKQPDAAREPISVRSVSMPKMPASILPPSLKVAAGYGPGVREHIRAQAEGFDNIIMRDLDGQLAESTTSSMIVIADGRVLAPPLDTVLDGITRRLVFDAAAELSLPTDVRAIDWDEVTSADELVMSSTNGPVVPVGRLDELELAAPGPITSALGEIVSAVIRGQHRLAERWLTPLSTLA